jgi:hydrogenase-4 component B
VVEFLQPVVQGLTGARVPAQSHMPWASLVPVSEGRSSYNGFVLLLVLAAATVLTAGLIHRFATRATRRSAIWDCGYPDPAPTAQYSSSSFAMPIRRVFAGSAFQVRETIDMPGPGEPRAARYRLRIIDPLWRYAYGPAARRLFGFSASLNRLQFLTIRSYLTLVFAALIVLLVVVAAWR